jgi:hypothetical protein
MKEHISDAAAASEVANLVFSGFLVSQIESLVNLSSIYFRSGSD